MIIDEELLDHIAHLSRLSFEGEERENIKKDLSNIISFMEELGKIDTTTIEPLVFMTEEINVFREDDAKVTIDHDTALINAPKKDSDYFRIPKVLSK
ncbi:MAG: Asp-tRNA(Asn)/Glu-tRNA(Gln) amidotransferase subunit GatC [Crocinitomicaceae bacterium]|nr:Asp-tRNA(Asn)/Glu-tRNA(Gln) amidotransferase subunit GatC [Crocinitomicaceae bacterium]